MNNLKDYIDDKLSDVTVSQSLSEKIMQQTTADMEGKSISKKTGSPREMGRTRRNGFRGIAVAAAICLFFACSVSALASNVPAINDWIYKFSPEFAQVLYPISKSSEDQGIKLEVLCAVNDDHNVVVYFSIQDTEGKGRVDETLDLCDSEYIDGPFVFGMEMLSYDEETNTAYYKVEGSGGEAMANRMVTFSIGSLMSNETHYDLYDTKIDLAAYMEKEPLTILPDEVFCSGMALSSADLEEFEKKEEQLAKSNLLKPDQMNISLGENVDFVTITNVGFVDGKLHIQTKWSKSFDNHGELLLVEKGTDIENQDVSILPDTAVDYSTIYFETDEMLENKSDEITTHYQSEKYIEYIYEIESPEQLADYNLCAWFVKDGIFTDGNWEVNFRMSDLEQDTLLLTDVGESAKTVEITPIGIYVEGFLGNAHEAYITITLKDGTKQEFDNFSSESFPDNSSNLYTSFGQVMDTNEIENVALNGINIYTNH